MKGDKINKSKPERKLLKQYDVPLVGGFIWLLREVAFYISVINFVMVSRIFWGSSTLVRDIFLDNYWLFLFGGLSVLLLVAMAVEYKIVLPSMFKFQQFQSFRIGRSPLYNEVIELRKDVKKLLEKTEEKK